MRVGRFLLRALAIFLFVAKQTLLFLGGWLVLLMTLRPRARRQAWFGARVLALFRDLGATFIKVGQIMSTRPDLLPPHIIHALETLQDDVGPFSYAEVQATVIEELHRPIDELFAEFSPSPIASASVAQVHKARLTDGRIVAVKVRRPNIDEMMAFDLQAMRLFGRALELFPSIRLLAPVETVEEFGRGIQMQLDFTIEAKNNHRFQANFAGDRDVLFPALVDELCTRRVLVMDFIDGTKVGKFASGNADPKLRKKLAEIGMRAMLKMVFEDGFVHADLHPGNVFITRDERLALLDLGLVGELDAVHRGAFARYFAAWATGDGKTMAKIMVDHSRSRTIPDFPGFEAEVVEFMQRYYGKRLGEVEVSRVILDMMGILRRYRVRANPTFTLVNIAIAVTEGIGKQLDPTVDLMAAALPFFARNDFFTAPPTPSAPASGGSNGVANPARSSS